MKFRRNAPAVLIGAVVVVVATMTLLTTRLFEDLTANVEKSQFELMTSIIEFNIKGAEGRAMARADMLANLTVVKSAVAAKDKDALTAEYAEMFLVQKEKHGVNQTAFFVPPATNLLRLHTDLNGDDVSKSRPLIVGAIQDHLPHKGISIARTGPALFGVAPINDKDGNFVGVVEVGIDFGAVMDGLKEAYGLELALFVEEEPLRNFATGMDPEKLSDANRVGKYMKYHATHWSLMKELATPTELTGVQEGTHFTRKANGVDYGVLLVPLHNVSGMPIGVVAVAKDFTPSRKAAGRSLVWQLSVGLFACVILVGLIFVVLRGFLLRPLGTINERFGALAGGDNELKVEDTETLCEELQELAGHHETLRTRHRKEERADEGSEAA